MIYVDKKAVGSYFFNFLVENAIPFIPVEDTGQIEDTKTEIILKPMQDNHCRPCPATKLYNCCNYYNTDVMEGCPFDCSYCILQSYLGHRNIQVSSDVDAIKNSLGELIRAGVKRRIGTGELSDSLALDHIFPYSNIISPLINNQDVVQFEYKTKSVNIKNLLNLNPKNIVVSWSINPQVVISSQEHGTASLRARLRAAGECAAAGYRIGFHFDPVIYFDGYEKVYEETVNAVLEAVPESSVEFISLSTFRATSQLIDAMRLREEHTWLLEGDFITAGDGKIRYFRPLRTGMLKNVASYIRKGWRKAFIYLCMERVNVWEDVLGITPGDREVTEQLFPWYQKRCGKV